MSRVFPAPVVAAALVAFASSWMAHPVPVQAATRLDLPSPLSGPGVGTLKKSVRRKIDRGWNDLGAGNVTSSRKRVSRIGPIPPAELLGFQILLVENKIDITNDLASFCLENPDYAAGWITLSLSAERTGLEVMALEAARRGAELWDDQRWLDRSQALYQWWVTDRIDRGRSLLESDRPEDAMLEVEQALVIDPDSSVGQIVRIEILIASDRLLEAEELLAEMPADPDVLLLTGQIAELKNHWQNAMDSYSQLPDDHPDRATALNRAQTRWRMSVLPTYAQHAIAADELTRGELAVILVSTQPGLETLPGGPVPVMSDIVDQPGQREIITVARLGIMGADRRGHLFHPDSPVDSDTVRETVNRTSRLLGFPLPDWCVEPDVIGSNCIPMPSPPNGEAVVKVVLGIASGADR